MERRRLLQGKALHPEDYLGFTALSDGLSLTFTSSSSNANYNKLDYSLDDGETWVTLPSSNTAPTIDRGETILFRINNTNNISNSYSYSTSSSSKNGIGYFTDSGESKPYEVSGNILSLLYKNDAKGKTSFTKGTSDYHNYSCIFADLFKNCKGLQKAENLLLSVTTLTSACYRGMFQGCISLTHSPELPSTIISSQGYYEMFLGCSSLTNVKNIEGFKPGGEIRTGGCWNMFKDCTSLQGISNASINSNQVYTNGTTNTVQTDCFRSMFQGCTSLTTVPSLYATTLGENSYWAMFNGCTSLTSFSFLPATTLANGCYAYMFAHCTSLVTAPTFPATPPAMLYQSCLGMFLDCPALLKAPLLNSTQIAEQCYKQMFEGCTSLTLPNNFSLPAETVYTSCYHDMFKGCTSLNMIDSFELPARNLATSCYQSMFIGCTSLTTAPRNFKPQSTAVQCCYQMFCNCSTLNILDSNYNPVDYFQLLAKDLEEGCYYQMFKGCRGLSSIPLNFKPWSVAKNCCKYMFQNCTGLQQINPRDCLASNAEDSNEPFPLADSCYFGMFSGCTNLSFDENTFLLLPATTLASSCYERMFEDCSHLNYTPAFPATTLANRCYFATFDGAKYNGGSSQQVNTVLPDTSKINFNSWDCVTSKGLEGLFFGTSVTYADLKNGFTRKDINGDNITVNTRLPVDQSDDVCLPVELIQNLNSELNCEYCYLSMFEECRQLDKTPKLSSSVTAYHSYDRMFYQCTSLTAVFALPATSLSAYCCSEMFCKCTSLETAPEISATSVSSYSCSNMFQACTNLKTPPSTLESTSLTNANNCYEYMFSGCSKLTSSPLIKASSFGNGCFYRMFNGTPQLPNFSTSNPLAKSGAGNLKGLFYGTNITKALLISNYGLTELDYSIGSSSSKLNSACCQEMFRNSTIDEAPALKSTEISSECCQNMFYGCTSLTKANAIAANQSYTLPAESAAGASYCYDGMFYGCTSLTQAPTIALTQMKPTGGGSVGQYCCRKMFRNCTSLTTAPVLLTEELTKQTYEEMFAGCSSLNYIKCMATKKETSSSDNSTLNWVNGVSSSGTFVYKTGSTIWSSGNSGYPSGWSFTPANS